MSDASLPYLFDTWYPVVRPGARPTRVIEFESGFQFARAREAWDELAPGASILFVVRSARGLLHGMARRAGRPSAVRRFCDRLGNLDWSERFFVLPSTGGGFVLLNAQPGPGFRAGTRLLPAGRRRWKVLRKLFSRLGRLGLQDWMGLDEACVLHKIGPPRERATDTWNAAPFPHSTVSVASGVPGLYQTTVAQLANRAGEVEAYLKLSTSRASVDHIAREGEILEKLARLGLEKADVPRLLARGELERGAYLVQRALPGPRSPDELRRAHVEFLVELLGRTRQVQPLAEITTFVDACERLEWLEHRVGARWVGAMSRLRDLIRDQVGDAEVRCSLAHGDFTPWNLILDGERLRAFDWEYARYDAPALHDLFHFLIQTDVLVVHSTDVLANSQTAYHILQRIRSFVEGPASALVTAAETSGCDWRLHLALYLFDVAAHDEWINHLEEPPFEQVLWLRKARLDLIELIARELEQRPLRPVLPFARGGAA